MKSLNKDKNKILLTVNNKPNDNEQNKHSSRGGYSDCIG